MRVCASTRVSGGVAGVRVVIEINATFTLAPVRYALRVNDPLTDAAKNIYNTFNLEARTQLIYWHICAAAGKISTDIARRAVPLR